MKFSVEKKENVFTKYFNLIIVVECHKQFMELIADLIIINIGIRIIVNLQKEIISI